MADGKRPADFPNEGQTPSKLVCESGSHSSKLMDPCNQEHRGAEECGNKGKSQDQSETTEDSNGGNKQIQKKENASAVRQNPPLPPGPIQFTLIQPDSISLIWGPPKGQTSYQNFRISWKSERTEDSTVVSGSNISIRNLLPGEKYAFEVVTLGEDNNSESVSAVTHTGVPAPEKIDVKMDQNPVLVTWKKPERLDRITYVLSLWKKGKESEGEECFHTITSTSEQCHVADIKFKMAYIIRVSTVLENGYQGKAAIYYIAKAPEKLTVVSVTPTSAELKWSPPQGMDQIHTYQISYNGEGTESRSMYADKCSTVITDLQPCTDYFVSVRTKLNDGQMSVPAETGVQTAVPPPEELIVVSEMPTFADVSWSPPQGMAEIPHSYQISYDQGESGSESKPIYTDKCSTVITNLQPYTNYNVSVRTKLNDGQKSAHFRQPVCTAVPVPKQLKVGSVTATSAKLTWSPPQKMGQIPYSYQVSYSPIGSLGSEEPESKISHKDTGCEVITDLQPDTKYNVSIYIKLGNGRVMKEAAEAGFRTVVPIPGQLKVDSVTATSAKLTWSPPQGMGQIPYSHQISYSPIGSLGSKEPESKIFHEDSCCEITDLQPDTKYDVSIYIKLGNGRVMKEAAKAGFRTEILTKAFYTIVIGNTQNHHKPLKARLMSKTVREVNRMEDCDFILGFCVIVSRVGTDMEAALKEIPDSKPVILSVMHHTFDPDHVTPDTSRFVRGREITVVDILFHEDKGILKCQKNTEAEQKINKFILACPESKRSILQTSVFGLPTRRKIIPLSEAQLDPATHRKESDVAKSTASNSVLTQRGSNPGTGHRSQSEQTTKKSKEVTYCVIVTGNTLGSHKEFQKRLAERVVLPNEVSQTSVVQCSFLLVFCPVVSSVGADIERALTRIPEDKSSILVMMHHTFNPDYLPPEGRGYIKSSNILVVDCLFYEDTGLLKCQKNDEAFEKITKWILGKFPNLERRCHNVSLSSATGGWMPSISSFSWGFIRK